MPFHITMETNHQTYTMALSLNERHNCLKLYDWAFALPLSFPQKKKKTKFEMGLGVATRVIKCPKRKNILKLEAE